MDPVPGASESPLMAKANQLGSASAPRTESTGGVNDKQAAKIICCNVTKTYRGRRGELIQALGGVNLEVWKGEFVSIVGPSGCGKSTLLYIIGGFLPSSSGTVLMDGREVRGPDRSRGIVFQEHSLFPWKTVLENVAYGPRAQGLGRRESRERARHYLALVGLPGIENRYPRELSGGMRQRVAIARTLAADAEVVLLDEPLGALDALSRVQLQEELARIWQESKKTMVMVTHSIEEAIFLSDRIYVMSGNPGTMIADLDVGIPRPRLRQSLLQQGRYTSLEEHIWSLLKGTGLSV